MPFHNNPNVKDGNGEGLVKRYIHQPLENDHFDTHFKIHPNGKVTVKSKPRVTGKDPQTGDELYEYDEVTFPASLVFKLAMLLKATRQIVFVSIAEAKAKDLPEIGRD